MSLQLDQKIFSGIVMTAQNRGGVLSLARRIEDVGFDSIWVGDHVSFYVPILESLTALAFVAGVTERVRLGTAVYLVPLRHPTTTAKVASTLDVLSNGRLTLGVGVGGEFPPEFEACGVPVNERGSRTNEGLRILRRLWSEDNVEHRGKHFSLGPVSLNPKPVQPGGPRIVVGGRKQPAFRRAGRLADGYVSHMCSAEMYRENLSVIGEHAAKAGRGGIAFETSAFVFTILDDNYETALDRAAQMLGMIYNRPFRDAAKKYCLLGRPEDCVEQMQSFVDAGCRGFIFSPLMDPNEFIDQASAKILPELGNLNLPR